MKAILIFFKLLPYAILIAFSAVVFLCVYADTLRTGRTVHFTKPVANDVNPSVLVQKIYKALKKHDFRLTVDGTLYYVIQVEQFNVYYKEKNRNIISFAIEHVETGHVEGEVKELERIYKAVNV